MSREIDTPNDVSHDSSPAGGSYHRLRNRENAFHGIVLRQKSVAVASLEHHNNCQPNDQREPGKQDQRGGNVSPDIHDRFTIGRWYAAALNRKTTRQEREGGLSSPAGRTPVGEAGELGGGDPCTEYLRSELRKHAQSNASFYGEPQTFADLLNSLSAGKPYTRTIQPQSSRLQRDAVSAPQNTNLAANIIPLRSQSRFSFNISYRRGNDLCGNED